MNTVKILNKSPCNYMVVGDYYMCFDGSTYVKYNLEKIKYLDDKIIKKG